MKTKVLLSPDTPIHTSSVYLGFLILRTLTKQDQLSLIDLHSILKKEAKNYNYSSAVNSLMFLYTAGLIDFAAPYIYRTKL